MKTRVAALAVVVAALGLGGCSSSSGSSGDGSSTINEWVVPSGQNGAATTRATLDPLVAQFKQQTGITVKYSIIQWSDLLTKINAAIASGQGPDLTETGNTWSASLSATNAFAPWTAEAFDKIGGKDKFIARTLTMTGLPGKAGMSIPLYAQSEALYYNKAMFAQAGISSPPTTWDEFIADAKKLTDPSKGQWGVSMDMTNLAAMETWDWILATQFGGHYFNNTTNKATANDPKVVQALTSFLNWIGSQKIMSPDNATYPATQAETQFAQGKAAMTITQAPSFFKAAGMPDDAWAAAAVPMTSANPPADQAVMSHVDTINVAIMKSSKHLDAVYQWLKFLTDPTAQTTLNSSYGTIPPTVAAASKPQFTSNQNDKVWLDIQSKYAIATPYQADAAQLEEAVARAIGQLSQTAASKGGVSEDQVKSALDGVQAAAVAREAGG
jgi:ABC-type glycerol-3-phosphate transport system substrate-binding protein